MVQSGQVYTELQHCSGLDFWICTGLVAVRRSAGDSDERSSRGRCRGCQLPIPVRVAELRNGAAIMPTPRSSNFPVHHALGLLFPRLATQAQDNPGVMKAQ